MLSAGGADLWCSCAVSSLVRVPWILDLTGFTNRTALSTLALVIQLWSAARLQELSLVKVVLVSMHLRVSVSMVTHNGPKAIATPWFAYFCILAEALVFGLRSPDSIKRLGSSIYCAITTGIPYAPLASSHAEAT